MWLILPGGDACLQKLQPVGKYTKLLLLLHWIGSVMLLSLFAARYWIAEQIVGPDGHLGEPDGYEAVPLAQHSDGRPDWKDPGHRAIQSLLDGKHADETLYYARMDPEMGPARMEPRFEAINHGSREIPAPN